MLRWESLSASRQAAISTPVLVLVFFGLNLGPFNQPLWRSILYGIMEGGVFTGMLLWVTAGERRKRPGGR